MDNQYPVNFIEHISEYVINGGTLPKLCKKHDYSYSKVMAWIYSAPERSKAYEHSLTHRNEFYVQQIMDELAGIAFSDLKQLYDDEGKLLDPKDWPEGISKTIQAVEHQEEYSKGEAIDNTKRVKMWDKLRALELLGKTMSLYRDRVEHSGSLSLEELVSGSYKQVEEQPKLESDDSKS